VPPSAYQVLLWDFDGTLADTLSGLLGIYNDFAVRDGYRPITDPEVVRRSSLGTLLRTHRISLLRLPFLIREVLSAQRARMSSTSLFPGLTELLQVLHDRGYRLGVVSSNNVQNIRTCLRANGVEHLFDGIVGCSRLFGKARVLRRVRRFHAATRHKVLYIGDEVRDIDAAHRAGVDVAAVTWGMHAPELLAQRKPDHLIDSPNQLLSLLTEQPGSSSLSPQGRGLG
jgi:phosphoglycolate phosphatase